MKRFLFACLCVFLACAVPCTAASDDRETVESTSPDEEGPEVDSEPAQTVPDEKASLELDAGAEAAPAAAAEEPVSPRIAAKEAELLYEQAVRSYESGNSSRARELYGEALKRLGSMSIDAATGYQLKDEFFVLMSKLNTLLDQARRTPSTGRAGRYAIPMDADNELVRKYLKLYTEGKARSIIKKALERSGRYRDMIRSTLKDYDLPEELVYLPVVESLYNVNDLSRAGALGLWQIMPSRARALGLKVNYWIDERKDPVKSTRAAAQYLKELYLMFDDWHLALAAYNRGEFGLARDLKYSKATNIEEFSDRQAGPRETQRYVPQFIACTLIADNCTSYGYDLAFDEPLRYDTVTLKSVVDLKVAAECAGTDVATIRALNPAILAWCTPHGYPDFELRIPYGTRDRFIEKIAQVKDLNPSPGFIRYKVKKGDHLGKIARKYCTTMTALKEDNHLKSIKYLRIGQVLMVRPGRKYFAKNPS